MVFCPLEYLLKKEMLPFSIELVYVKKRICSYNYMKYQSMHLAAFSRANYFENIKYF